MWRRFKTSKSRSRSGTQGFPARRDGCYTLRAPIKRVRPRSDGITELEARVRVKISLRDIKFRVGQTYNRDWRKGCHNKRYD
jgi:hypothetical protein